MAMSIKSIIAEAIKITCKNPMLVFLVVSLKTLIHHSVAYMDLLALPISISERATANLEAFQALLAGGAELDDPILRDSLEDLKYAVMISMVLHAAFYLMLNLAADVIAAAYAAHMARLAARATCEGLVSTMAKSWKRALLTDLLTKALGVFASAGVLLCAVAFFRALAHVAPVTVVVLCVPVVSAAALRFLVDAMLVSGLARVIAVVDDGCYGFAAVGKAWRDLKGRRVQGFLLSLFSICLCSALSISGRTSTASDERRCYERAMRLSRELADASVAWFSGLIVTVFFEDCSVSSQDNDDDGGVASHQD